MTVLSLVDPIQSNDALTLQVEDSTGVYDLSENPDGWGAPNTELADLVVVGDETVGKYHLVLTIVATTSDSTRIVESELDLVALYGPFASTTDLVFDITCNTLGLQLDTLPDGWYELRYSLYDADDHTSPVSEETLSMLVDGVIREQIYQKLRMVPYASTFERYTYHIEEQKLLLDPLYVSSLFEGMLKEVTIAKKEEILFILSIIERLVDSI